MRANNLLMQVRNADKNDPAKIDVYREELHKLEQVHVQKNVY
jgi:hypothetical protein